MPGPRPLPWLSGVNMREANQNWAPYKRGCPRPSSRPIQLLCGHKLHEGS